MSELSVAIKAIEKEKSFDIASLEQRQRLGDDLAFDEALQPAKAFRALISGLTNETVGLLPHTALKDIADYVKTIHETYQKILGFQAGEGPQGRSTLIGQLKNVVQEAHNKLGGPVAIATIHAFDFDAFQALKNQFENSDSAKVSDLVAELQTTRERLNKTEEALRRTAAESGIGAEARFFKDEAKEHGKRAVCWAVITILMTLIVISYGIATFYLPQWLNVNLENTPSAIQFTASKLIILFALTYFLFICARNFQANRHNQIINTHRQNALATYRTLVEAGEAPELQGVVLHHAAAAIYHLHDTGLLRHSSGQNSNPTDFIPKMPLSVRGGAE